MGTVSKEEVLKKLGWNHAGQMDGQGMELSTPSIGVKPMDIPSPNYDPHTLYDGSPHTAVGDTSYRPPPMQTGVGYSEGSDIPDANPAASAQLLRQTEAYNKGNTAPGATQMSMGDPMDTAKFGPRMTSPAPASLPSPSSNAPPAPKGVDSVSPDAESGINPPPPPAPGWAPTTPTTAANHAWPSASLPPPAVPTGVDYMSPDVGAAPPDPNPPPMDIRDVTPKEPTPLLPEPDSTWTPPQSNWSTPSSPQAGATPPPGIQSPPAVATNTPTTNVGKGINPARGTTVGQGKKVLASVLDIDDLNPTQLFALGFIKKAVDNDFSPAEAITLLKKATGTNLLAAPDHPSALDQQNPIHTNPLAMPGVNPPKSLMPGVGASKPGQPPQQQAPPPQSIPPAQKPIAVNPTSIMPNTSAIGNEDLQQLEQERASTLNTTGNPAFNSQMISQITSMPPLEKQQLLGYLQNQQNP